MNNDKKYFSKQLLHWNKMQNRRLMPWKGETDPYKIWLSEIILQQTRVEQGWAYYDRFVAAYPDIKKLAGSPDQKIFKLWEGLGYYTRCKNLIATAKFISKERKGIFPDTYEEIINLKGVGPYTAAAIASFAFNLPYAVVDGNVFRVLSRFFGIEVPTDGSAGKKLFTVLAQELLEKKKPGIYNQAIMDFGALICKPQNPLCSNCTLNSKCAALVHNRVNLLPVKAGKLIKKHRWFNYFIIEYEGKVYVRKRSAKDIWENLYEFILFETDQLVSIEKIKASDFLKNISGKNKVTISHVSKIYRQQLTHQTIQGVFVHIKLKNEPQLKGYKTVTYNKLNKLPFPKLITGYLSENEWKKFER